MKIGTYPLLLMATLCLGLTSIARADSYMAFETKRIYSANADYFVEVRSDKRATLYRTKPKPEQIWSRVLPQLPQRLFVTNDGARVVIIDHYYGNNGKSSAKVVVFLDEAGKEIAAHELGSVAALKRVQQTVSTAHWYYGGLFSADQTTFTVETIAQKCEPSTTLPKTREEQAAFDECFRSDPYEELLFSVESGALLSRADIRRKYADQEKRLLRELEFVLEEHPPHDLSLGYSLLKLANFYEEQKQYSRAKDMYEEAIKVYTRKPGADSQFAAEAKEGRDRVLRKLP